MFKRILFCFLSATLCFGFWMGQKKEIHPTPELELPIRENKAFVFLMNAYNQAPWIQRSLHSIFEQEYDNYRVIMIDDGSIDNTLEVAQSFTEENNQQSRVTFLRNEEKLGLFTCLCQGIENISDQEIIIPIEAKDWLAHSGALARMNAAYQNPDIWIASTSGISFPSYKVHDKGLNSFYTALIKQIEPVDRSYMNSLRSLANGRIRYLSDVLLVSNEAAQ